MIEVKRNGKTTKFAYDGFGMLAQKTFHDGSTEVWVWDGLALIHRGSDIYVNKPHISGGVPILSKTDEGVRYHEHYFLGTTLWIMDTKCGSAASIEGASPLRRCCSQIGYPCFHKRTTRITGKSCNKYYQDTTIFGEGSIQKDRSARFTGKPYDEDLQAYVFPYRNYDASTARWRSSDPAGYPDGINQHFYADVPTYALDLLGLKVYHVLARSGGMGFGHSAWIVGNPSSGYSVYSYGSSSSGGVFKQDNISTLQQAYSALRDSGTGDYNDSQMLVASAETDAKFKENANKFINETYNPTEHNCYDLGPEGLKGTADENRIVTGIPKSPNLKFNENNLKGWQNNAGDIER